VHIHTLATQVLAFNSKTHVAFWLISLGNPKAGNISPETARLSYRSATPFTNHEQHNTLHTDAQLLTHINTPQHPPSLTHSLSFLFTDVTSHDLLTRPFFFYFFLVNLVPKFHQEVLYVFVHCKSVQKEMRRPGPTVKIPLWAVISFLVAAHAYICKGLVQWYPMHDALILAGQSQRASASRRGRAK
jgi:hypothetical protein